MKRRKDLRKNLSRASAIRPIGLGSGLIPSQDPCPPLARGKLFIPILIPGRLAWAIRTAGPLALKQIYYLLSEIRASKISRAF